jgi:hypothetical protein
MDQINWLVIGILLLLSVIVFTVGKKDETGGKKEGIISCGPAQSANGHNSWPGNDNSGNDCTHQTVSAALPGRFKRVKMHGC